jgi:predicted nucleotidyltransferase
LSSRTTIRDYNQIYLKKGQQAATVLKLIPSILLVGISGSVADGRATRGSDIDFFVVCKKGRIFSARFFAKALLTLLGWSRKNHDRNPAGKICLNYFLAEDSLDFKPHSEKVIKFHRHSIILFSRGKVLHRLIEANKWLRPAFQLKFHRRHHLFYYQNRIGDRLESYLKSYQSRLIETDPITSQYPQQIIYNDSELRFHPPKEQLVEQDIDKSVSL